MNILSLLIMTAAVVVFCVADRGVSRFATIAFGLALFTTALILQFLWTSADLITF